VINPRPGEGRYARLEREQRWVLSGRPAGLDDPVSIVDHYLTGTRLRLRRVAGGGAVTYKLGQKVRARPEDPESVALTTIYLGEEEYAAVARLGGAELSKTRWRWDGQRPIVVDVLAGPLEGLVLAEVELGADEPRRPPPPLALRDVTADDRFSGGALAHLGAAGVERLLAHVSALRREGRPGGSTTRPPTGDP
jgi:CYTH domain-containing protein